MKIIFIVYLCLMIILGLLPVSQSFAQQGSSQTVEVSGYCFNNSPLDDKIPVAYGKVLSRIFKDADDSNCFLDPSGDSVLNDLTVSDKITFENVNNILGPLVLGDGKNPPDYFIDFDDASGEARFHYLNAVKFHMEDEGPSERGGGKYVYDIAESVLVAEGEAGDVVVISSDADITVIKSKKKFDTAVAGVISSDPKVYMGYSPDIEKEGKYKPLALAGVVLCKVSAENGPIKKGDILVSSSLPGHAMRAGLKQLTPGMMLGSALENFDQGEGKIYILVN